MCKNKFVSSSRKAFTLLELLAALAIAAVLVVALMGLFSSTVLTETKGGSSTSSNGHSVAGRICIFTFSYPTK